MKIADIILEGKRIPRKKGQPAKSKKHSDLSSTALKSSFKQ